MEQTVQTLQTSETEMRSLDKAVLNTGPKASLVLPNDLSHRLTRAHLFLHEARHGDTVHNTREDHVAAGHMQ